MNDIHNMLVIHEITQLSPRRQRSRVAKTEKILQTALTLVLELGLDGLTINRLANELDYAPGALYRYFPSKDALLAELNRMGIRSLHQNIQAHITSLKTELTNFQNTNQVKALVALLSLPRAYASFHRHQPDQFRLMTLFLADPKPVLSQQSAKGVLPEVLTLVNNVSNEFAAATQHGALEPGDAFARTISLWASVHGCLQISKMAFYQLSNLSPDSTLENLVLTLLKGWGAKQADLEEALSLIHQLNSASEPSPEFDLPPSEGQGMANSGSLQPTAPPLPERSFS